MPQETVGLAGIDQRRRRIRSFKAAGTPLVLVWALIAIAAVISPMPWRAVQIPKLFQLAGMWYGGAIMPFVDHVHDAWWVAIVGWTLAAAWLCAVRGTRVGEWPWGLHAGITTAWVVTCGLALGHAVRDV